MDMTGGYGRAVLAGISQYTRSHTAWSMWGDPERVAVPIDDLPRWRGDGIIAMIWQEKLRDALATLTCPIVNVASFLPGLARPSVISDNIAVGKLAAKYFAERGYRSFAYCGFAGHHYSEVRGKTFAKAVEDMGFACEQFHGDAPQAGPGPGHWDERQAELSAWAQSLRRPTGMLCCNDVRARHVTQACLGSTVRIPEDLAILGVDNDELVCELSNPPLSSIVLAPEQVGYEAARILDGMMNGGRTPSGEPVNIPPRGVVTRRSSDILAITDSTVADAVRFIHDHAAEPIGVDDVVAAVPASRRVLERRFRDALGRTIGQEICNARIDRAKRLLIHSDVPAPDVANGCGFQYVQQFNAMFKRVTGVTPTAFRRQYRQR
jgi:LacI family transcriptional regulator